MPYRRLAPLLVLTALIGLTGSPSAQPPAGTKGPIAQPDLEPVQKLNLARKQYQKALEDLWVLYHKVGDVERKKWAEEELRQFQRIPKQAFILALDVPPESLKDVAHTNVPEANRLLTWAISFKEKGWKHDEYIDNQRRAEILLQDILNKYPQSDKISDAAYHLGDVYESKAYKQYRRAAEYYKRCYQWNSKTHLDARIRAARLFDRELKDRQAAIELYREITTHETDQKRIAEAQKRLNELSGNGK